MKKLLLTGTWLLLAGLAACGGSATDGPAATTPEPATESDARTLPIPSVGGPSGATTQTAVGPLKWDVPQEWTVVQPSSSMRLAQYEVHGTGGEGECVVFYFGPGQGGDPVANAHRWAGQFTQSDGSSSVERMSMAELEGGAMTLKLVEVTGTYDGGMSMGAAPPTPKPGWMLLGGIAEGSDAPWFFKFTGPQATVEENRDAFVAMLRSIRQEI